jgi:hypothetical protein
VLTALRFGAACVVSAIFIHLTEFHLGLGVGGRLQDRLAFAGFMVMHCPVLIWLMPAAICAVAALMVGTSSFRRDLRVARGFHSSVRQSAENVTYREPLRPTSVIAFCAGLTIAQWLIFSAVMYAMPMTYVMRMHGAPMTMAMVPAIPGIPVCVIAGIVGGLIVALLERRIRVIATLVAALIQVMLARSPLAPIRCPESFTGLPLSRLIGPAIFSRPPPRGWLPS